MSEFQIGPDTASMTPLDQLSTPLPDPDWEFHEWRESIPLGSGGVRGAGRPWAVWRWGFLTQAQYNMLRYFCAGASEDVGIRTMVNDGSYVIYAAKMTVQEQAIVRSGRVLQVEVQFLHLTT